MPTVVIDTNAFGAGYVCLFKWLRASRVISARISREVSAVVNNRALELMPMRAQKTENYEKLAFGGASPHYMNHMNAQCVLLIFTMYNIYNSICPVRALALERSISDRRKLNSF